MTNIDFRAYLVPYCAPTCAHACWLAATHVLPTPTGRRPGGGGGGGGVLLAGSPAEKSCQERALATQSKIVFSIDSGLLRRG